MTPTINLNALCSGEDITKIAENIVKTAKDILKNPHAENKLAHTIYILLFTSLYRMPQVKTKIIPSVKSKYIPELKENSSSLRKQLLTLCSAVKRYDYELSKESMKNLLNASSPFVRAQISLALHWLGDPVLLSCLPPDQVDPRYLREYTAPFSLHPEADLQNNRLAAFTRQLIMARTPEEEIVSFLRKDISGAFGLFLALNGDARKDPAYLYLSALLTDCVINTFPNEFIACAAKMTPAQIGMILMNDRLTDQIKTSLIATVSVETLLIRLPGIISNKQINTQFKADLISEIGKRGTPSQICSMLRPEYGINAKIRHIIAEQCCGNPKYFNALTSQDLALLLTAPGLSLQQYKNIIRQKLEKESAETPGPTPERLKEIYVITENDGHCRVFTLPETVVTKTSYLGGMLNPGFKEAASAKITLFPGTPGEKEAGFVYLEKTHPDIAEGAFEFLTHYYSSPASLENSGTKEAAFEKYLKTIVLDKNGNISAKGARKLEGIIEFLNLLSPEQPVIDTLYHFVETLINTHGKRPADCINLLGLAALFRENLNLDTLIARAIPETPDDNALTVLVNKLKEIKHESLTLSDTQVRQKALQPFLLKLITQVPITRLALPSLSASQTEAESTIYPLIFSGVKTVVFPKKHVWSFQTSLPILEKAVEYTAAGKPAPEKITGLYNLEKTSDPALAVWYLLSRTLLYNMKLPQLEKKPLTVYFDREPGESQFSKLKSAVVMISAFIPGTPLRENSFPMLIMEALGLNPDISTIKFANYKYCDKTLEYDMWLREYTEQTSQSTIQTVTMGEIRYPVFNENSYKIHLNRLCKNHFGNNFPQFYTFLNGIMAALKEIQPENWKNMAAGIERYIIQGTGKIASKR